MTNRSFLGWKAVVPNIQQTTIQLSVFSIRVSHAHLLIE
jgi:hypothetical protein